VQKEADTAGTGFTVVKAKGYEMIFILPWMTYGRLI